MVKRQETTLMRCKQSGRCTVGKVCCCRLCICFPCQKISGLATGGCTHHRLYLMGLGDTEDNSHARPPTDSQNALSFWSGVLGRGGCVCVCGKVVHLPEIFGSVRTSREKNSLVCWIGGIIPRPSISSSSRDYFREGLREKEGPEVRAHKRNKKEVLLPSQISHHRVFHQSPNPVSLGARKGWEGGGGWSPERGDDVRSKNIPEAYFHISLFWCSSVLMTWGAFFATRPRRANSTLGGKGDAGKKKPGDKKRHSDNPWPKNQTKHRSAQRKSPSDRVRGVPGEHCSHFFSCVRGLIESLAKMRGTRH